MTARITIGIAGAGIGGLAAAALLARAGHQVVVADQFDRPRPVGSGLVIQPVGQAVLDRIGAGDAARHLGAAITRMLGQGPGGRRVLDVGYATPARPAHGLAIHRAALFSCLWHAASAAGVEVTAGARVHAAPRAAAGRWLATESGRLGPFDLVIDASGARSPLSPLQARPLPYGAIWGTVPWPHTLLPRDRLSQRYLAARRMLGVLPVGRLSTEGPALAAIFWSLRRDEALAWPAADLAAWKADGHRALARVRGLPRHRGCHR